MVVKLHEGCQAQEAQSIAEELQAFLLKENGQYVLVNTSGHKQLPNQLSHLVEASWAFDSDIQLANREYQATTRSIELAPGLFIGGETRNTVFMSGPCSVESEGQLRACAEAISALGGKIIRGGCYKPRTSPYTFQGLGLQGLQLLAKIREEYGLSVITEIRDATHAHEVAEYTDIVQIGAKAMYDHGILRIAAESGKPVLLKRGFGSTLKEFVQMAEFVLSHGNPKVILCERGIRTFETKTRFTLDLCGVEWLKKYTNLPVVVDPSHAIGYAYGVPSLALAGAAAGVDGLLIESHPDPSKALSDAAQQLKLEELPPLYEKLKAVTQAVGAHLV